MRSISDRTVVVSGMVSSSEGVKSSFVIKERYLLQMFHVDISDNGMFPMAFCVGSVGVCIMWGIAQGMTPPPILLIPLSQNTSLVLSSWSTMYRKVAFCLSTSLSLDRQGRSISFM